VSPRALAFALAACAAGCGSEANVNEVDAALLGPALLREEAREAQAYLAKLPEGVYREYRLDTIGRFYVDDDNDFIKRYIRNNHVFEKHLVELFAKHVKPGTTVIDAGAHIGVHTVKLATLAGPKGRVYAFEPQRKLHRELTFNLRLNALDNAVPLRFALGHTAAVIEMDATPAGNEGGAHVGKGGDKVELRTLDSFGFRNVSLLKIDVEHFEDFLLEGAQLTIARNRPVIVIEIMGGYDYATTTPIVKGRIDATRARLKEMGYKVQHIHAADYLALPE
jgi:FkbM family methyltransferase